MIKSCQKQLVAMVSRATETLYTRSCQCRLSQSFLPLPYPPAPP